MTFSQWLFGGIDNPFKAGQWGPLHICVMLSCAIMVIAFAQIVKHSHHQDRTKKWIVYGLVAAIAFFEIMIRFVHFVKLYHLHLPEMEGLTPIWILLPRPWCAISCWSLIASVFVRKRFFYNFASLSALLCAVVFFVYPGVGFNNVHLLFENWYSILTHALLLTTSITLMCLGYTDFRYREIWKESICFILTFIYAFTEIYVLQIHTDPLYFMPDGDIQADILRLPYGLYLFLYILVFLIYVNTAYMINDRENVKKLFAEKMNTAVSTLQ